MFAFAGALSGRGGLADVVVDHKIIVVIDMIRRVNFLSGKR